MNKIISRWSRWSAGVMFVVLLPGSLMCFIVKETIINTLGRPHNTVDILLAVDLALVSSIIPAIWIIEVYKKIKNRK